jgi:hypothetical protein
MREFMANRRKPAEGVAVSSPALPEAPPAPELVPPPAAPAPKVRTREQEEPPGSVITYGCGHKIGVRYLQGGTCPACAERRRKERGPGRDARKLAQEQRREDAGRLPDGSRFEAVYDAGMKSWTGTLTFVGPGGEAVSLIDTAGGVMKLLRALDRQYRGWEGARTVEAGACPETVT